MSNILIIGNGFDIYHGLPTRYSDFLFLANNWNYFIEQYNASTASDDKDELIDIRLDGGYLSLDSLEDFAKHKYIFDTNHIDFLNKNITNNA